MWNWLELFTPVAAGGQFRHHYPPSPGLQVSLSGHLTPGGVLVHLPDALHLPAAPQAHVGRRLHVCSLVHRHCREGEKKVRWASGSSGGSRADHQLKAVCSNHLCVACSAPGPEAEPWWGPVAREALRPRGPAGSVGPAAPAGGGWPRPGGCCVSPSRPRAPPSAG